MIAKLSHAESKSDKRARKTILLRIHLQHKYMYLLTHTNQMSYISKAHFSERLTIFSAILKHTFAVIFVRFRFDSWLFALIHKVP